MAVGPQPGFDLFCRVVDNFGDAGVCWRLARQLADAPGVGRVRLWIDAPAVLHRLQPDIDPDQARQHHARVEILHWTAQGPDCAPLDVVIEAFACSPPERFIARMRATPPLWINLDYLSAEHWVEGCHLQTSFLAHGLRRHFFFPGFTPATGGLLRETGLIDRRKRWQACPAQRLALLHQLNLSADDLAAIQAGTRVAVLFAYPDAPVQALLQGMANAHPDPFLVLVPEGLYPQLAAHDRVRHIPFLAQDDFDRLLWSADLNLVRGEDSLVRALWAGQPMLWQAYVQDDGAQLDKVEALLARSPLGADVQVLMHAWNRRDDAGVRQGLARTLTAPALQGWRAQSGLWCDTLAQQPDLVTRLLAFCAQNLKSALK